MGGRLDSTNIITPILSVITNISFDHTQFLGNTLGEIAGEKAGIIKPKIPVVIGEWNEETQPVFIKKAHEQNSPIHFAHATDADMNFELKGNYQKKNFCTISAAVECLKEEGIEIKDQSIKNGFEHVCEQTGLRGRWEKLNEHPLTICDTGHNLAGWEYLEPQIASVKADTKHIVFGMVDDKDVEHVMGLLEKLPKESTIFYWTQPSTKRAIPVDKLYGYAQKHGLNGTCYQTIAQAFNKAKANAKKDDFIFIGGSSYVVSDLLSESF